MNPTKLSPVIILCVCLFLLVSIPCLQSAMAPALLPTITRLYLCSKRSTFLFFRRSSKAVVSPPVKYMRSEFLTLIAISCGVSEYSAKSTVLAPRLLK